MLLDVAAALGAVLARPGPRDQTLIGGQHQRRALAREVAFAQAATNTPQDKSPSSQDMHKPIIIFCRHDDDGLSRSTLVRLSAIERSTTLHNARP